MRREHRLTEPQFPIMSLLHAFRPDACRIKIAKARICILMKVLRHPLVISRSRVPRRPRQAALNDLIANDRFCQHTYAYLGAQRNRHCSTLANPFAFPTKCCVVEERWNTSGAAVVNSVLRAIASDAESSLSTPRIGRL